MMKLSEVVLATHGELIGEDVEINSVGIDSRSIKQGQLFVAIKGENFDGHDYVAQSLSGGAAAALVEVHKNTTAVKVKDTRLALGDLAAYWRKKIKAPIVAITGSNGKTTVKEMLASILMVAAGSPDKVLATQGNLNNDLGMPLTLLKARPDHAYVILEMGMNHLGEISYLTNLAKPNIAIVNNAGEAHLGELGSMDAIAKAKGEIFEGLTNDGIAIINQDDVYADFWKTLSNHHRQITFGLNSNADVTATFQLKEMCSELRLKTQAGEVTFDLPVAGIHNVRNALAASAVATALNISLKNIAEGLAGFSGVKGRLQEKIGRSDSVVIDDTYNANPVSMKAAIDVLGARQGERVLVMGDMGELGSDAEHMHAEIGRYARQIGIEKLFAIGQLSRQAAEAFGLKAKHYDSIDVLSDDILSLMNAKTTVLVKGSRFMQMERVVEKITKQVNGEKH